MSTVQMNEDLKVISNWVNYSSLFFNGDKVQSVPSEKYLGLVLDSKLTFNEHNNKISKCNKNISVKKHWLFQERYYLLF